MTEAMKASANRMAKRYQVLQRLRETWGPEVKWPIGWFDITPSIEIWADAGNTLEEILAFIDECVVILWRENVVHTERIPRSISDQTVRPSGVSRRGVGGDLLPMAENAPSRLAARRRCRHTHPQERRPHDDD